MPGNLTVRYKIINKKKRVATAFADALGFALWTPAKWLLRGSGQINPRKIKEILVLRTAYTGDVIMTLPMIKPLKELYPGARITFLTASSSRQAALLNPYVDEVLEYDAFWFYNSGKGRYWEFLGELRQRKYDLVIDARADIRDILLLAYPARAKYRVSYDVGGGGFLLTHTIPYNGLKHKVEYHIDIARFLGAKTDEVFWGIRPGEKAVNRARGLFPLGKPLIAIHPGGRKPLKGWPEQKFSELAKRLASDGASLCITGSETERPLAGRIAAAVGPKAANIAGKTDLETLLAVIGSVDLFITGDSAPLHMASAMNTPTVAIFGPSKSKETGPYGNPHRVVEKDFPCRSSCDEDVCNYVHHNKCMEDISVDDVYAAAKELMAGRL